MIRTCHWMGFLNYTWHTEKLRGWASHNWKLRDYSWLWGDLWIEHITGYVKSLVKKMNWWLKICGETYINLIQWLGLMSETTKGGSWSQQLCNTNHSSLKVRSWDKQQIKTSWLSWPWKRLETEVKTNMAPDLRLSYKLENVQRLNLEHEQI